MDRVLASEAKGRGFDPRQPRHSLLSKQVSVYWVDLMSPPFALILGMALSLLEVPIEQADVLVHPGLALHFSDDQQALPFLQPARVSHRGFEPAWLGDSERVPQYALLMALTAGPGFRLGSLRWLDRSNWKYSAE